MAPTWKSQTNANAASTSVTITLPNTGDGAASGDFGLLVCTLTPSTFSSDPSGWSPMNGSPTTATTSSGKMYLWTKTYASGDLGASLTLTPGATSRMAVFCATYSAATIDITGKDETNTSGTSVVAPSVVATVAGLLVCVFGCIGNTSGDQPTWTAPGSMTERVDITATSATLRNGTCEMCTETLSSSGATGTRTATSSLNVQRQGYSFVLATAGTQPGRWGVHI